MAIKIEKTEDGLKITLNNGHAEALKKIKTDFDILNEEKTVGFMLSVMSDANGKPIETIGGSFVPSEKIKNNPIKKHDRK